MSSKKKTPSQKTEAPPTGKPKPRRLGIRVLDDDATPATPEVTPDAPTHETQDESNAPMPWDPPSETAIETPTTPIAEPASIREEDCSRIVMVHVLKGTGVLEQIGNDWLEHLNASGTSASTLASYAADFGNAKKHFGSMDAPNLWTEHDITGYENAMSVTHTRSGKPKAMPTIMKTRRVLRMALTWAFETRRISSIPYATKGRIPLEQFEK